MEYWDLYDENRKPLNKTHQRGLPQNENEYHIVVLIVTVNSKNQILITHRDPNKESYPNLWEVTVGSALSGETSKKAALRELFEETGIKCKDDELFEISTIKESAAFIDVYLTKKDIEIENLTMQPGETTEAKWISFSEFDKMAENGYVAGSIVRRLGIVKNLIFEKINLKI